MQRACFFCTLLRLAVATVGVHASATICRLTLLRHAKTRYAQPHRHKHACDADNNVDDTIYPQHAKSYPMHKVETKHAYCQPVECADNGQYKCDYGKHVECFVQVFVPPFSLMMVVCVCFMLIYHCICFQIDIM